MGDVTLLVKYTPRVLNAILCDILSYLGDHQPVTEEESLFTNNIVSIHDNRDLSNILPAFNYIERTELKRLLLSIIETCYLRDCLSRVDSKYIDMIFDLCERDFTIPFENDNVDVLKEQEEHSTANVSLFCSCIKTNLLDIEKISRLSNSCCKSVEFIKFGGINEKFLLNHILDLLKLVEDITKVSEYKNDSNVLDDVKFSCSRMFGVLLESIYDVNLSNYGLYIKVFTSVLCKMSEFSDEEIVISLLFNMYKVLENVKSNIIDGRYYFLMCGLMDLFSSKNMYTEVILSGFHDEFWILLQKGFYHRDNLTRKRCIYILKSAIEIFKAHGKDVSRTSSCYFVWNPEYVEQTLHMWDSFLLLIETLQEKQLHLVKPVLVKLDDLISIAGNSKQGCPVYLHPLWVVTVIECMLHHQSSHVICYAARKFLSVHPRDCPLLEQDMFYFMTKWIVVALKNPKLYVTSVDEPLGHFDSMQTLLPQYFTNCLQYLSSLSTKRKFFGAILCSVGDEHWGPAALFHIVYALNHLEPSPLWDCQSLINLRDIAEFARSSVESYIRGAIEWGVVRLIIRHLDVEQITPHYFSRVLAVFQSPSCLSRGNSIWFDVVDWLKYTSSTVNVESQWSSSSLSRWMSQQIRDLITSSSVCNMEASSRAAVLMFLLLIDSDVIPITTSEDSSLIQCIAMATAPLLSINTSPYASILSAESAVQFIALLLDESMSDVMLSRDLARILLSQNSTVMDESVTFMTRRLVSGEIFSDYNINGIELYSNWLKVLIRAKPDVRLSPLMKTCLNILLNPVLKSIGEQMGYYLAWSFVSTICNTSKCLDSYLESSSPSLYEFFCSNQLFTTTQHIDFTDWSLSERKQSATLQSMGVRYYFEIFSDFLTSKNVPKDLIDVAVDKGLNSLDLCYGQCVLAIFSCLTKVVPLLINSGDLSSVLRIFEASWKHVSKNERIVAFWMELRAFVSLVLQPESLTQPEKSPLTEYILKVCRELREKGESRPMVYDIFMTQFAACVEQVTLNKLSPLFTDILLDACTFGMLSKKQDRQMSELINQIAAIPEYQSFIKINKCINPVSHVRMLAIHILTRLDASIGHQKEFGQISLQRMCQLHYKSLSEKSNMYFTNSPHHRRRNKIAQIVLLLERFVDETNLEEIWTYIWRTLYKEYQPSVRYLLQWFCVRVLLKFPRLTWRLFDQLSEYSENKVGLCACLSVICMIGPFMSPSLQKDYYERAISSTLPYCLVDNFNIRVHAQAVLSLLWQQSRELQPQPSYLSNGAIESCVNRNSSTVYLSKTSLRLIEHFYFTKLHPVHDFSLETIFYSLPRLSRLLDADLLMIKDMTSSCDWSNSQIPLLSGGDGLRLCDPDPWHLKGQDIAELDRVGDSVSSEDFQKKSVPWKYLFQDETLDRELKRPKDGLIVVTSLLDKPPNIGGLCRTSEIFGASQFIIGDLKYIQDDSFQSLSVTAHKWIPVTEVNRSDLERFIQEKKSCGYTLVAVEQTSQSVPLTSYKFPAKTLIILGNEKQGIPVNLLQNVDVCVEIPQTGMIRSLNVHVCGALLIWEYARQQCLLLVITFKKPTTDTNFNYLKF